MKPWQFVWPTGKVTADPVVLRLALGPDPGAKAVILRDGGRVLVHYSRTRVYLDRDAWEALKGSDDVLVERIRRPDSPVVTIALTRSELEAVFGSVRETESWQRERCYHFPMDPPATTAFLVTREGEPVTPPDDQEPERRSWMSRADLGATLRSLHAEFGQAPIPGKVLLERGLSPSAAQHAAYWSGSNAGGRAASDVGLAGTLRKRLDGAQLRPELLLRPATTRPGSGAAASRPTRASLAAAVAAKLDPPLSSIGEQHLAENVRIDVLGVLERALGSGAGGVVDGTLDDKAAALVQRLDLGDISIEDATGQLADTTIEVLDRLLSSIPERAVRAGTGAPGFPKPPSLPPAPVPAPVPEPASPKPDAWTALPVGPVRDWLSGLEDQDHRRVLAHIAVYGSVSEPEVARLLGGPPRARRFAATLDAATAGAPMVVRVDVANGVKRYVREEG